MLKRFIHDKQAIFWTIIVGTLTMIIATGTWVIAMVVTGSFMNAIIPDAVSPYTQQLGQQVQMQGAIIVVIIDVGMLVWMGVSAFRNERQEGQVLPF